MAYIVHCSPSVQSDPGIPSAILADPALTAATVRVLVAIVEHASGGRARCWPGNARLAEMAECSLVSVKRAVAALARLGYVRVERRETGWGYQRGRMLVLAWRERVTAPEKPSFGPPMSLGGSKDEPRSKKGLEIQENVTARRDDRTGAQTPPATPAPTTIVPTPIPGRTTAELIADLPGRPERAEATACRIAADLRDPGSLAYYRARCGEVARGTEAVERLAQAFKAGQGAGTVARPGAIFVCFWRAWIPRPQPAMTPVNVATPESEAARRLAREAVERQHEEVRAYLADAAADPSNPWHAILRRRSRVGEHSTRDGDRRSTTMAPSYTASQGGRSNGANLGV